MKILITGIHGFVGSNLVKALQTNHTIYGLDIVTPRKEGVEITLKWDEFRELPDVDVVIHLAGKAHDTKNLTDAQVYFDINTVLTQRMYDWFLMSNAQKFIFFSSVKAAADTLQGEILTEEVVPKPVGPYGESKIAAENYIKEQRQKNKDKRTKTEEQRIKNTDLIDSGNEKNTYLLRPCMIHGPGNKGNLNLLYKVVKLGIPWPLGDFDNQRSFCSIDNLSFVVEQLIEKEIEEGIYNVCDDETVSTNELIALISKSLHTPTRIWKLNKRWIQVAAKLGTALHLPLTTERLQKLTENYIVSNKKIKQAIGIETMPVRAGEGLKKTLDSF